MSWSELKRYMIWPNVCAGVGKLELWSKSRTWRPTSRCIFLQQLEFKCRMCLWISWKHCPPAAHFDGPNMDGLLSPDPLDISLKKNGHRGPPLMASDDCLNIPLLGATGIGKSTFINTFVNYLTFDTLNNALNGEMQTLIYSTFSTSTEDDEETEIVVGVPDDREGTTLETRVVLIPKVAELTQFQMETGQYGW